MRVNVVGGGPGGLYASMLLKKAHPTWEITLFERNPRGATYGWGVVFSDQTLTALREADVKSYTEITESFVVWDAIDVYIKEQMVRCGGHGFAGIARPRLLDILQNRCDDLGVEVHYDTEVSDLMALTGADLLIAADGINSRSRELWASHFRPSVESGSTRYIWFGTHRVFDSFTFIFRENEHGLFTVHAYPFDGTTSTFIVECTEETWRRAELNEADEADSLAFCQTLFSDHLHGQALLSNYSRWFTFPTVRNRRWHHENIVLLGDAAHTAHFSIGSGTKLAMEDAIALVHGFEKHDAIEAALNDYEQARKPRVEGLQEAAVESQRYFENVGRYLHFDPLQFTFHLLTRSGRITYDNLKQRDPYFVAGVERWYATQDGGRGTGDRRPRGDQVGPDAQRGSHLGQAGAPLFAPPPMFASLALRGVTLPNRVVLSAPASYSAEDGMPGECYGAQLERLTRGGAGLVVTEPVAVSPEGRITSGDVGIYRPEHVEVWARIVSQAHAVGDTSVALTLSHAGRRGSTRPRTRGIDRPLRSGNWPLLAPSAIPFSPLSQVPEAMTQGDMEQVRAAFVQAARWATEAGFDLLQLHMAHGYLLASFLSPVTNQRADEYGGSLENCLRFPLEIFDAVRAVWPDEKPIVVAIPAADWIAGGLLLDDAIIIARALKAHDCDLVTVMAGQTAIHASPSYDTATYAYYSDVIRNEAHIPTLATAYLTTSDQVNTLLAGGRAELALYYPVGA
ncbi:MAG: FAD-dependent monooxygenase [Ardenticatenaceae bacterium]